MKKLFFASLIVLITSCNFLFAQTAVEKKVGTLKTYDGELISMYDYASKDADSWSFHDEKGKFKNIKSKKIAWMMMGSRRYLNHNIRDNKKEQRILELVAMTAKYKLFFYEGYNNFIYIFDMDDKLVEDPIKLMLASEGGSHGNNEKAAKTIAGYFSDCPDFVSLLNENVKNHSALFGGGYTACPSSPDVETLFK